MGIPFRRNFNVRQADRIGSRFDPAGAVASVACHSLASEADEIDLGIPLPAALADRAHGIQAAITRLKGHDVERMRAVGPVAVNDIAGVGHANSLLGYVL